MPTETLQTQDIVTLREIMAQPQVWRNTLEVLSGLDLQALLDGHTPAEKEWIFVGCGTSYYLAQAAAASLIGLTGCKARAVPASEILIEPELVFPGSIESYFPVLISRSGHTSEVLQVADLLRDRNVLFLGVTCDGRELEAVSPRLLKVPVVEHSTVMSSSFTSMLLGLQYLAAFSAGKVDFLDALTKLPDAAEALLDTHAPAVESFASRNFIDFAFLGQGPLFPIACETALKVMESSSTYAQYFHTLEFRHGPKSVVDRNMLVGILISERSYDYEAAVLREMKELGGATMAVVNRAHPGLREQADLLIELNLDVPEMARLVVYVLWGQLLGSYRGLAKGLNPDNPTNLSRVVTI